MIELHHPLLDRHGSIAWDLDGTLVDGPKQAFLGAYLVGRPDKRHHLVTFRRVGQRAAVETCLSTVGLGLHLFQAFHFCPDPLRDAFDDRGDQRLVREFRQWKGRAAAAAGCTVLVDDDADLVRDGCRLHGIVHVDSWSREFPFLRPPSSMVACDAAVREAAR